MTKAEAQKIFALKDDASLEELHQAYYNLMKVYHPCFNQDEKNNLQQKYQTINEAYELLASLKGCNVKAIEESKAMFISYISEYIHSTAVHYNIIDSENLNVVLKYLLNLKVRVGNVKDSLTLEILINEFKNKMQEFAQIYFDQMVDKKVNSMSPAIYAIISKYQEIVKNVPDIFAAHKIVEKMFKSIAVFYTKYNDIRSRLDAIIQKYPIDTYVKEKLPNLEDECLKKIAVTLEGGNFNPYYDEFESELKRLVEISKVTPSSLLNSVISSYQNYLSTLNLSDFAMKNSALEATDVLKLIIELLSNISKMHIDIEKLLFLENINWNDLKATKQKLLEVFGPSLEFESCDIFVSRDVPSFFYNGLIKVLGNDSGKIEFVAAPDFSHIQTMTEKSLAMKYISLKEFLLKSQFIGKSYQRTARTVNDGYEFIDADNCIMLYLGENGALLLNLSDSEPFCTVSPEYLIDGKYSLKDTPADLSAYANKHDVYRQITDSINSKVSRNSSMFKM